MTERTDYLRQLVLAWTIFTTTFTWTPTMRLLLKPEISQWNIFGVAGSGRTGPFWILPLAATVALLLFYLEGRGKLRPLFHALLLGWHLPLTAAIVISTVQSTEATFMGAAWGVEIPLFVLAFPFSVFSVLAVVWVVRERRGSLPVSPRGWSQVGWRKIAIAVVLLPVAAVFFWLGEGFDGKTKIAIATTVVQWILLTEGLRGPAARFKRKEKSAV
ncbi:MAG: hypothetical protein OEM62_09425 [Acidobacteriota bacterium]|nr:hypothetical protein [Acidobacteriota bacterium]